MQVNISPCPDEKAGRHRGVRSWMSSDHPRPALVPRRLEHAFHAFPTGHPCSGTSVLRQPARVQDANRDVCRELPVEHRPSQVPWPRCAACRAHPRNREFEISLNRPLTDVRDPAKPMLIDRLSPCSWRALNAHHVVDEHVVAAFVCPGIAVGACPSTHRRGEHRDDLLPLRPDRGSCIARSHERERQHPAAMPFVVAYVVDAPTFLCQIPSRYGDTGRPAAVSGSAKASAPAAPRSRDDLAHTVCRSTHQASEPGRCDRSVADGGGPPSSSTAGLRWVTCNNNPGDDLNSEQSRPRTSMLKNVNSLP